MSFTFGHTHLGIVRKKYTPPPSLHRSAHYMLLHGTFTTAWGKAPPPPTPQTMLTMSILPAIQ